MNSNPKNPGPVGVAVEMLVVWENEWYWVFRGLVYGVEPRNETRQYYSEKLPPKPTGGSELYKERVKDWLRLTRGPSGWTRKEYRVRSPGIPAELDVWQQLLSSRTSQDVKAACDLSRYWLNPDKSARPFVVRLNDAPNQFLKSKSYRYPASSRPSSDQKRILHFSRAMAGVMEDISSARAIDLIRGLHHGRKCPCMGCDLRRQAEAL